MLVKAGESAFITAEDLTEVAQLVPSARIEVVPGAGHSVQSDQPVVLRSLVREFVLLWPGSRRSNQPTRQAR